MTFDHVIRVLEQGEKKKWWNGEVFWREGGEEGGGKVGEGGGDGGKGGGSRLTYGEKTKVSQCAWPAQHRAATPRARTRSSLCTCLG